MELKYYLRGLGLGIAITAIVMGIVSSKNKTMTNEEIIARAKQLGMTENTVLDEINHKDGKEDTDKPDEKDADKPGEENTDKADDAPAADKDALQTDNSKPDTAGLAAENSSSKTSQESDNADNVANLPASDGNETSDVLDINSQTGTRKTDSGVDAEAGDTGSETDSSDMEAGDTGDLSEPMVITVGSGDGSYSVSKKLADVGAIESAGDFDTFLCNNGYDKRIRTGTYTIPANASEEQMARIITGAE